MHVVYLTSDLMFSSRVTSLAKDAGVNVTVVGTRQALAEQVAAHNASMVFIDLEHRDADVAQIVSAMNQHTPRPQLVAYGPHVKESLLAAAQSAGCDMVMPRGQFDRQVGQFLASLRISQPEQP